MLIWRPLLSHDLPALAAATDLPPDSRRILEEAWREMFSRTPVLGGVLEERRPYDSGPPRIVSGISAVFVPDWFVEDCLLDESPFPLPRRLADVRRRDPFVPPDRYAETARDGGLNLFFASFALRPSEDGTPPAALRSTVMRRFEEEHGGYRIKMVFGAVGGAKEAERARYSGWRLLRKYPRRPEGVPEELNLWGLGARDALAGNDSVLQGLFRWRPPVCGFSAAERALLEAARSGAYTEEELADRLGISAGAVRTRFRSVYERIEAVYPGFLGEGGDGRRGRERRRRTLAYLRAHPEEIRPY